MGDSQGKVGIYRVFSGKECKIDSEPLGGHNAMITSICSDDEHVYTFSLDNKFNVW